MGGFEALQNTFETIAKTKNSQADPPPRGRRGAGRPAGRPADETQVGWGTAGIPLKHCRFQGVPGSPKMMREFTDYL